MSRFSYYNRFCDFSLKCHRHGMKNYVLGYLKFQTVEIIFSSYARVPFKTLRALVSDRDHYF